MSAINLRKEPPLVFVGYTHELAAELGPGVLPPAPESESLNLPSELPLVFTGRLSELEGPMAEAREESASSCSLAAVQSQRLDNRQHLFRPV